MARDRMPIAARPGNSLVLGAVRGERQVLFAVSTNIGTSPG